MSRSFPGLLRATATILSRFGQGPPIDATRWDGGGGGARGPSRPPAPDAQAAKWWGVFTALSGVLEDQRALSAEQRAFLRQLLFGGIGSFDEFVLDEGGPVPGAAEANQELDRLRGEIARELGDT